MSCLESAQREDFYERQAGRLALDPVFWFSVFQDSLPKMQNARRKPGVSICRLCVRESCRDRRENSELLFPYPRKTSRNSRLMCAASCAASSINSTHFFPVGSNSI